MAWKFDLKNNTIALGWFELGDISSLSVKEIKDKYKITYINEHKTKGKITEVANELWAFYHQIKEGDKVIARKGRKVILSIGTVIGKAYYNTDKGYLRVAGENGHMYPNFIPVDWDEKEIKFNDQKFSMITMYKIPQIRYNEIMKDI